MNEPSIKWPNKSWKHFWLWNRINDVATLSLEKYFKSTITVEGINATEIYSFGEVLGLTVEEEIVRSLNELRTE